MGQIAAETPLSSGDADGGSRSPVPPPWQPLAPGALGADPDTASRELPGGLFDVVPHLPLTGPLADALGAARAGIEQVLVSSGHSAVLPAGQRLEALRQAAAARHVLDAALLRLTATFVADEVRALGATNLVDLLLTHTGADPRRAATEARLAAVLTAPPVAPVAPAAPDAEPDGGDADGGHGQGAPPTGPGGGSSTVTLGALGLRHAAGDVSTDVAALAQRTVASLPAALRRTRGAEADAALAAVLPGLTHAQAQLVCTTLAQQVDPDRADGSYDPDDLERRYLNLTVHEDGWVDIHGRTDPVVGAAIKAAVEHLSRPDPTVRAPLSTEQDGSDGGEGSPVAVRDERTAGQRRADALGDLVRAGAGQEASTRGGEPARVIVTTTEEQLRGEAGAGQAVCETTGRPLTRAALLHLACSGVLQAVRMSCDGADAAVLSLGRAVRLFSASQRRAMLARDGGCVVPGCTAPPGWLEAHHVHAWADGGPTDVSHGVLLCTRHHLLVTLGVWEVRMRDGVPEVRPPRAVDPLRRWLVNPRRALRARTVEQLELRQPGLWLDDPPDGRPAAPDIPSPRQTCDC